MIRTMSLKCVFSLFAAVFFIPSDGAAQSATTSKDPAQWALLYADELEKNRKALGAYSWQYRVEVLEDSTLLYVDLLEGRFDSAGNLQTTRIEQDLKIKERHGLLSKAGQEGRLNSIEEKIEFLKGVIRSYVYMSRGDVVNFFDKATVTEAVGYNNASRVDGEDVLNAGDSISLFGDRATAHPLFLTFSVPFDDKVRVDCSIQFRRMRSNSIFYAAEVTANFVELKKLGKSKALSIEVESFDFQKQ